MHPQGCVIPLLGHVKLQDGGHPVRIQDDYSFQELAAPVTGLLREENPANWPEAFLLVYSVGRRTQRSWKQARIVQIKLDLSTLF